MSKLQVAQTILEQLGGNKFIVMTGAKNIAAGLDYISFKIGRNCKSVNHVIVQYDAGQDLYNMRFLRVRGTKTTIVKDIEGVYFDMLQDLFTEKYWHGYEVIMKVFVLLYDNGYDGYDFHGVYSSKEKAEARIACFTDSCRNSFEIDEVGIDEEVHSYKPSRDELAERIQVLMRQGREIDTEREELTAKFRDYNEESK